MRRFNQGFLFQHAVASDMKIRTVTDQVYGHTTNILTEQSAEELTLKDIDDSVQRLLQLVVLLHKALFGPALVLLSLVEFGPVLLQKLQGPLRIWTRNTQTIDSVTNDGNEKTEIPRRSKVEKGD